ncbi:hypothetical protein NL676_023450 [Syzygium grande]|nr:hypothetical protein NL676_023450 [Syzygium grande]
MNLEFLEVKFFLYDALGRGLSAAARALDYLALGSGPPAPDWRQRGQSQPSCPTDHRGVGHLRLLFI